MLEFHSESSISLVDSGETFLYFLLDLFAENFQWQCFFAVPESNIFFPPLVCKALYSAHEKFDVWIKALYS
jgi:hypothetical protein